MNDADFGQAMCRLRGERTQGEVAARAGVSTTTWSKWERGRKPRFESWGKIALALGCSVRRLEQEQLQVARERLGIDPSAGSGSRASEAPLPTTRATSEWWIDPLATLVGTKPRKTRRAITSFEVLTGRPIVTWKDAAEFIAYYFSVWAQSQQKRAEPLPEDVSGTLALALKKLAEVGRSVKATRAAALRHGGIMRVEVQTLPELVACLPSPGDRGKPVGEETIRSHSGVAPMGEGARLLPAYSQDETVRETTGRRELWPASEVGANKQ